MTAPCCSPYRAPDKPPAAVGWRERLRRQWERLVGPGGSTTRAALGPVHDRSFGTHDFERFLFVWCEVARIMHISPLELHEDQTLDALCAWSKDPADTHDAAGRSDRRLRGGLDAAPLDDMSQRHTAGYRE